LFRSATVLPAVEKIGVGWFSTISAAFLVVSTLCTGAAVIWGRSWRDQIDEKRRAKRGEAIEEREKKALRQIRAEGENEKSVV
jgi:hypothetical protein